MMRGSRRARLARLATPLLPAGRPPRERIQPATRLPSLPSPASAPAHPRPSPPLTTRQGALDGGLDVPHSDKRFVGYNREDKELDTDALRKHIYGGHVAEYMENLREEEPEAYARQFARYVKASVEPDALEDLYKKVRNTHAKTRRNGDEGTAGSSWGRVAASFGVDEAGAETGAGVLLLSGHPTSHTHTAPALPTQDLGKLDPDPALPPFTPCPGARGDPRQPSPQEEAAQQAQGRGQAVEAGQADVRAAQDQPEGQAGGAGRRVRRE